MRYATQAGHTCRVVRFGRSELRENSTACHRRRTRFRRDPTMPMTCTGQESQSEALHACLTASTPCAACAEAVAYLCGFHDVGELVLRVLQRCAHLNNAADNLIHLFPSSHPM